MPMHKLMMTILALTLSTGAGAASDTQLIDAVKNGDQTALKSLLKKDGAVNSTLADGTTALHWAAQRNDLDSAALLLKAGANASAANAYNVTPLHIACTNRGNEMVLSLLKAGADAKAALWTGETALMECSRTGAVQAVTALLEAGADVNAHETKQGQTALMWAAGMGYADVVKQLIEHGADVNANTLPTPDKVPNTCRICTWKPSPGGFTALMFAARSGDVESVRLLLDAGADVNAATAEDGNALVIASASGHEQAALLLLEHGANPNVADDNGVTALHFAFYNGLSRMHGYTYDPVYRVRPPNMPALAGALLKAGADPNAKIARDYTIGPEIRGSCENLEGTAGATPFMLAAASADAAMLNLLAKYEADPQINMDNGTTPMLAAVRSSCTLAHQRGDNSNSTETEQALAAVKELVSMGLDINTADKRGNTPLHMAAFAGSDALVKYLIEQGAEVNVANSIGETPWSMASGISPSLQGTGSYGKHDTTATLLQQSGAVQIARSQLEEQASYNGQGNVSISRDPNEGAVGFGR